MKVLLVDEHPIFIQGLKDLLNRQIGDLDVLESSCFDQVIDFFESDSFDLILSNYQLPGAAGTDLLKAYDERKLSTPLAVIANDDDAKMAKRVLDRGARGFIPKSLPQDEIANAVNQVLQGKRFLTDSTEREIGSANQWPQAQCASPKSDIVTARQLDVIQLLAKGYRNKRISRILNLSTDTVKEHIQNIFIRLGVDNRTLCVIRAKEMGFDRQH